MSRIDSRDFAKYLVYLADQNNISLNYTKLQKITYICDGLLLASGKDIVDEHCRVWDHGPVYPRIYKWYDRNYGKRIELDSISESSRKVIQDTEADEVMKAVLVKFKETSATELSEWTHRKNSPWDTARNTSGMYSKIDKNVMESYFKGMSKK